jgi:hypothetical protein
MMQDPDLYEGILIDLKGHPTYQAGVRFKPGKRRHDQTVAEHIADLELNLDELCKRENISMHDSNRLRFLIHTHDTLKMHALPAAPIKDRYSHSSLAAEFASEFTRDDDMIAMIQWHEEPYAIYRKFKKKNPNAQQRLDELFAAIKNWRLFLMFVIIDNCVPGCSRQPIRWIIEEASQRFHIGIDESWIID